jgi:hypothetical protein
MPYFRKGDLNVLFLHIPKTGGTSIEYYFSEKYSIPLNTKAMYTGANTPLGTSYQHLPYKEIVKHKYLFPIEFDNLTVLTVVRNPYDRILSDLFYYKLVDAKTEPPRVYDAIQTFFQSAKQYDNHPLPQYEYVTNEDGTLVDHIHILKTETLQEDMKNLGYKDFHKTMNKNRAISNTLYDSYLNVNSLECISSYYEKDFDLFGYDRKL